MISITSNIQRYKTKSIDISDENVEQNILDAHDEVKRFLWHDAKTLAIQTRLETLTSSSDAIIVDFVRSEPIPVIYDRQLYFLTRDFNINSQTVVHKFESPVKLSDIPLEQRKEYKRESKIYRATIYIFRKPLSEEDKNQRNREVLNRAEIEERKKLREEKRIARKLRELEDQKIIETKAQQKINQRRRKYEQRDESESDLKRKS